MKSLIEINVLKETFQETVDHYNNEGIEYISSSPGPTSEYITVLFRGDIHNLSQYANQNNKSYLEFDDGSRSPLYIKRERNFWED